jgi:hypothetical protein
MLSENHLATQRGGGKGATAPDFFPDIKNKISNLEHHGALIKLHIQEVCFNFWLSDAGIPGFSTLPWLARRLLLRERPDGRARQRTEWKRVAPLPTVRLGNKVCPPLETI